MQEIITKIVNAFEDLLPVHFGPMTIQHNPHMMDQMTVKKWVENLEEEPSWASDEERELAIKTNSMWSLVWFPTMTGYCTIFASTLDKCFQAMYDSEIERLEAEKPKLIMPSVIVNETAKTEITPPKLIIK